MKSITSTSILFLMLIGTGISQEAVRPNIVLDDSGRAIFSGNMELNGQAVDPAVLRQLQLNSGPQAVQPAISVNRTESSGIRKSRTKMVPTLPRDYESLDKNGDGQIGMYEWDRSKYSEFVKLDKNGDGFLTPQELNSKGNVFGSRLKGGSLEKDAMPNPGNLSTYAQKNGETFTFSVTGRSNGAVYGTGTYTTDSDLATVAVHAGLIKDGEKGVVQITIVDTPNQFEGTTANGVTSSAWGAYPSAFTIR